MTGPARDADISDVSVGQLVGDVTRDLSTLMRQEIALAKAEVRAEAKKAAIGSGLLVGAAVAGLLVLVFLGNALWWALENVMDAGLAGLITAIVWAVVAGILALLGRARLRTVEPKPERTVETVQQIPDALKGQPS